MALSLAAALVAGLAALRAPDPPSAEPVAVPPMAPQVLLVTDGADPFAERVAVQARTALARAKTPFLEHDLSLDPALPSLDGLAAVLTVAERVRDLPAPDAARLADWVEAGGGLGVLYRAWSPGLSGLFGFADAAAPVFVTQPEVLVTAAPLMPGADDMELAQGPLSAFDARPAAGCVSLADRVARGAVTGSGGWTCQRGEGRVVYWNHALFGTKLFRGHILQTLALLHPAHARPMAGTTVFFLDDFPSPASNVASEPVWSQTGQTPAEFYADTWYPDMRALADRYGLTFTSTVIYAYNANVRPPFPVREWLGGRVREGGAHVPYSPWIMSQDARHSEMALHGYNHQPLRIETWGSEAAMRQSLERARERWETERIAPLPRTYVPPMNWIDSVGVAAVRKVFPEITTFASSYVSDPAQGAGRDFGPEPWAPDLYAYPRNTAGYIFTDAERLKMLTVLHTVGVWSHFVHPDEVFANEARAAVYRAEGLTLPGELGWNENDQSLLPSLDRWLAFADEHYPWLQPAAAEPAAGQMRALDALAVAWAASPVPHGRRLTISASRPGQAFLTWSRPHERLAAIEGGEVLDDWRGRLMHQYVVRAEGTSVTLTFKPDPTP